MSDTRFTFGKTSNYNLCLRLLVIFFLVLTSWVGLILVSRKHYALYDEIKQEWGAVSRNMWEHGVLSGAWKTPEPRALDPQTQGMKVSHALAVDVLRDFIQAHRNKIISESEFQSLRQMGTFSAVSSICEDLYVGYVFLQNPTTRSSNGWIKSVVMFKWSEHVIPAVLLGGALALMLIRRGSKRKSLLGMALCVSPLLFLCVVSHLAREAGSVRQMPDPNDLNRACQSFFSMVCLDIQNLDNTLIEESVRFEMMKMRGLAKAFKIYECSPHQPLDLPTPELALEAAQFFPLLAKWGVHIQTAISESVSRDLYLLWASLTAHIIVSTLYITGDAKTLIGTLAFQMKGYDIGLTLYRLLCVTIIGVTANWDMFGAKTSPWTLSVLAVVNVSVLVVGHMKT